MKSVKLDEGRSAYEQKSALVQVSRGFMNMLPELSVFAERGFRTHKIARCFELLGPSMVVQFDPGDAPDNPDTPAEPLGINMQTGTIQQTLPMFTRYMDPRPAPFNGNPEHLASFLGCLLAAHVSNVVDQQKALFGALLKHRSEVHVFGRIPVGMGPDENGRRLTDASPMLRARMELLLRRK